MDTTGKTGIEISPGLSGGQKVIGKLLHAVHLDVIGRAVGGATTMVITIDGETREEPFYEAHFVECPPGKHRLRLEWRMKGTGTNSPSAIEQDVDVETGRITEVVYTMKNIVAGGGTAASLEVTGSRAS
jgi:hypothetical protein